MEEQLSGKEIPLVAPPRGPAPAGGVVPDGVTHPATKRVDMITHVGQRTNEREAGDINVFFAINKKNVRVCV
jgi:hypothetical protein